ncbi:MAG: hypothetical protein ACI4TE_04775 [Alphaproteobacteria bacterium]
MTAAFSPQKKLSLKIDAPLYSLLEKQADETGVGLNDFIQQLLADAMNDWCEYCDTLRRLSSDDEPRHLCLK